MTSAYKYQTAQPVATALTASSLWALISFQKVTAIVISTCLQYQAPERPLRYSSIRSPLRESLLRPEQRCSSNQVAVAGGCADFMMLPLPIAGGGAKASSAPAALHELLAIPSLLRGNISLLSHRVQASARPVRKSRGPPLQAVPTWRTRCLAPLRAHFFLQFLLKSVLRRRPPPDGSTPGSP